MKDVAGELPVWFVGGGVHLTGEVGNMWRKNMEGMSGRK